MVLHLEVIHILACTTNISEYDGVWTLDTGNVHKGQEFAEQYADKQSTADDGSFDKILESDISRQKKLPLCIISADAANCYDRVHHTIIALPFLTSL